VCGVCLEVAVPPVVLAPCGHVVCHHDFEQLRERAARVRVPTGSYGFRCPECRRTVVSHAIVEAMRATSLATAPSMVRDRPKHEIDAEAMRRHAATLPAPAEPSFGDFVNAHVEDEDVAANVARPPFSVVRMPGVAMASMQVAVIGDDSLGRDIQRRVREALELAGLVHHGSVRADDDASSASGHQAAQVAHNFVRDSVDLLEARVPQDLRMWTREGSVPERICYKYTYYRPSIPARLSEEFVRRMGERGVSVERVERGYELTLPLENENLFLSS